MSLRDIVKLFEEIELRLIASFKRNLERHRKWESEEGFFWPAWQAEKLQEIEHFRRENKAVMAEYKQVIEAETRALMQEQFAEGIAQTDEELEAMAKHPPPPPEGSFFGVNAERLESLITDIQKSERAAETSTLRLMDDVYRQTILKAETAMSTGAATLPQALDIAAKDFLERGVTGITYSNGRRVNIASYAEMALRTAATRSFLSGEAKRRAEYGIDTVLVSQYGACSKTCLPWQGRVYIDDVWSTFTGEMSGKRGKSTNGQWYPLLSVAVEGGLFHPNCRHTLSTWVESVSTLPAPLDAEKVSKNAKLEERQRTLEREVRRWKRLAEGTLDTVAAEGFKRRVKQEQKVLRDFVGQYGDVLRRASWREQTYGVPLENQPDGAILKAGATSPIPVTNAAVQRVPLVRPHNFTPTQAKTLRKRHRELLHLAQGDEPNTEYAALLDEGLNIIKTERGQNGRVRVKGLEAARYFVHNHPSGLTFSQQDVEVFLQKPELIGISAVGNDGTIYYFGKTERFNVAGFSRHYMELLASQPDYKSTPETYTRFMEALLEGGKRYGFEYFRG